MRPYSKSLAANESWPIPRVGDYIRLFTTSGNADVEVECQKKGSPIFIATGVQAGLRKRTDEQFDRVVVTNGATPQTVTIYIGEGEVGYDQFNLVAGAAVSISGPLSGDAADALATLGAAGLVAVSSRPFGFNGSTWDRLRADNIGGAGALRITERGYSPGVVFASNTVIGAAANETVLAPASNTGGLILWRAELSTFHQSAANAIKLALLAKSSAPATDVDGDLLLSHINYPHTMVGLVSSNARRERPIFVAAGKGLYFRNAGTVAEIGCLRSVEYTLL
jgi:hypothetical protein